MLLDGVEDLDDPDILDPSHTPSDPVWEPHRRQYPAVFGADGGWRLFVRATLLMAHGRTALVDTGVGGPASPAMSIDLAWQRELARGSDADRAIWHRLLAPLEPLGVLQAVEGTPMRSCPGIVAATSPATCQAIRSSRSATARRCCCRARDQPPGAAAVAGAGDRARRGRGGRPEGRSHTAAELSGTDRVLAPAHFAEPFGRLVSEGPTVSSGMFVVGRPGFGDPGLGLRTRLVGLLDHGCSGGLEAFELAVDVGGLDSPDQPARLGNTALHPVLRPDGKSALPSC